MKKIFISLILCITVLSGCEKDNSNKTSYDSMHFVREGGGQIDFNLYITNDPETLEVIVDKFNFHDTTFQFNIIQNTENEAAFKAFYDAINNRVKLAGDFKQSQLLTGTWSYIYFVNGGNETEVTNTSLRKTLHQFENLVVTEIQ